jgi:UTP-glucose-1-phosphate uridylyltransferase
LPGVNCCSKWLTTTAWIRFSRLQLHFCDDESIFLILFFPVTCSLGPVEKKSLDLVILAAGMGSRFGGLKQVQPVGPADELIIEYSVFDAMRAGFNRLVLVIRKEIEADFRESIGRRLESKIEVQYVFQEPSTGLPPTKVSLAQGRIKPWGTGHALLVAREVVRGPFAVINADDFYGASGYAELAAHFERAAVAAKPAYAMVGYPLRQTLSEFGTVSRGLCATDAAGKLQHITEVTKIEKTAAGATYADAAGTARQLTGNEIVSMNFWGFTPAVFAQLEKLFAEFLAKSGTDPKTEFYLPTAISNLNERGEADVALLKSTEAWFGITYREDLASSQAAVKALVASGRYPSPLWR